MHSALERLSIWKDPAVLVGADTFDDAGIYRVSDELALVQTDDFFTPIVDDPYDFGGIAMANALSDVYAKGGTPKTALNILCYPADKMSPETLQRVLQGAADALKEAGVSLLGGHTVRDTELKFGAAVTGFVHPKKYWANATAQAGDALVLAKPIGTGILTTALRGGKLPPDLTAEVTASMRLLNAGAAAAGHAVGGVHACTDITGFGLAGHAGQMAVESRVRFRIENARVPRFGEVRKYASEGCSTGGGKANADYWKDRVAFSGGIDALDRIVLMDPQTSGGLFFSVAPDRAGALVDELKAKGYLRSAVVGEVLPPAARTALEFV